VHKQKKTKSYQIFYSKINKNSQSLISECISDEINAGNVEEISCYLTESFGNDTRIDYGTGHEMAFAM
jgi:serine/threonine-protein phosphatase 2A activator